MIQLNYSKEGMRTMSNDEGFSKLKGAVKLIKSDHSYEDQDHSAEGLGDSYSSKSVYDTTFKDASWENVVFSIDQLKIAGDSYSQGAYANTGTIEVTFTIQNDGKKDVCLEPDTAYILLKDNQRVDAKSFDESIENVFSKHKTQHGKIKFTFEKVEELADLNAIYIKFCGHYKGEKEEKVTQVYEVPLYV